MPVPPKRLKDLIEGTVDHHASLTHPDLQEAAKSRHDLPSHPVGKVGAGALRYTPRAGPLP
ncbi:MAG: hypothetical protein ACRDOK_06150 [Streptosporangiaceae bacterium]